MILASAMFLALLIDAAIGWPERLYGLIGHPVGWIGRLISALERGLNRSGFGDRVRLLLGVLTVAVVVGVSVAVAIAIAQALPSGWIGLALAGVMAWPFVAARSLHRHVASVAHPLVAGDIEDARQAVSMIVGRNPETLDEAGIARATLESLAENASDGVVAPLFWGVLLGLPGIVAYKAINTLDSMIGYRNERYMHFGRAAARLDDLVNLIPARLTGFILALVSGRAGKAIATMLRDAGKHRSPNAGWPEAAMAAGLGVRVSGPRVYDGKTTDDPWVNEGAPDPIGADILLGLALYRRAVILFGLGLLLLAGFSI